MIRVGLTGNIGSGKSIVARVFEALNVPVFRADDEGRKLLDHPGVKDNICNRFGSAVFIDDRVDRKKLASVVFSDREALDFLTGIIHPRVRNRFDEWCSEQDAKYIIHEAAILMESGFHKLMDRVILVTCPESLAISRVMDRDNVKEEEVRKRMDRQWPEEKKRPLADHMIVNDGREMVVPQVLTIHKMLSGL